MTELYAILDPEHCAGRDPLAVASAILSARPAALQLRAKQLADRERLALARALRTRCRAAQVPFWLNDRVDLALLVDADGLHLGQDDLPIAEARKLWGERPIGRSTHSLEQATKAASEGADLLGFGPVFDTASKLQPDPSVGLSTLGQVCARVRTPIVAIGGIKLEHAAQLRTRGARYAAVISALCAASDPAQATRELKQALGA